MTYHYRNPSHEYQQQTDPLAGTPTPERSRRGCWTAFAVVVALILLVAGVAVAFTLHAARQLEEEIVASSPAVESLLEEHEISMLDLFLLSRELEGASQEEVILRAQEMGLSEEELREIVSDSEVRELIDQFLNR